MSFKEKEAYSDSLSAIMSARDEYTQYKAQLVEMSDNGIININTSTRQAVHVRSQSLDHHSSLKSARNLKKTVVKEDSQKADSDQIENQRSLSEVMSKITRSQRKKVSEQKLELLTMKAPAYELEDVWALFLKKGIDSNQLPDVMRPVVTNGHSHLLLQLQIEDQGLEQIFQFLIGCSNLRAVFLKGNRIITRDLPWMCKLHKLVKADISGNKIHFMPAGDKLASMECLEFLRVEKNEVFGWQQLELIAKLKALRSLSISQNPCTKLYGSRQFLIKSMPQLKVLDGHFIMDYERPLWTDAGLPPFNPEIASVNLTDHQIRGPSSSEDSVISDLVAEHVAISRANERVSPILLIQKTFRMWIQKARYKRKRRTMRVLYWALNRWYVRRFYEKWISYRKEKGKFGTRQELKELGQIRRVQRLWRKQMRVSKLKKKYCIKLQSNARMFFTQWHLLPVRQLYSLPQKFTFVMIEHQVKKIKSSQDVTVTQLQGFKVARLVQYATRSHFHLNLVQAMYGVGFVPERRVSTGSKTLAQLLDDNIQMKFKPVIRIRKRPKTREKTPSRSQQKKRKKKDQTTFVVPKNLVRVEFQSRKAFYEMFQQIMEKSRTQHFYILPEKIIQRLPHLIRIQAWWKGVCFRKSQQTLFEAVSRQKRVLKQRVDWRGVTQTNCKYSDYRAIMRVVNKLRDFFNFFKVRQRINALSRICSHIEKIEAPTLCLDQDLYMNLESIIDQNQQKKGSCFPEADKLKFGIDTRDHLISIRIASARYSLDYHRDPLPTWFNKRVQNVIRQLEPSKRKSPGSLCLFHSANQKLQQTQVLPFSKLVPGSQRFQVDPLYVQVHFPSVEEAKTMATLVALLTVRHLRNANHFVKMSTPGQAFSDLYQSQMLIKFYQVIRYPTIAERAYDLQLKQEHGGQIIRRKEPYSTIVRSRPRQKGRIQEQVLILMGADLNDVAQTVIHARQHGQIIRVQQRVYTPENSGRRSGRRSGSSQSTRQLLKNRFQLETLQNAVNLIQDQISTSNDHQDLKNQLAGVVLDHSQFTIHKNQLVPKMPILRRGDGGIYQSRDHYSGSPDGKNPYQQQPAYFSKQFQQHGDEQNTKDSLQRLLKPKGGSSDTQSRQQNLPQFRHKTHLQIQYLRQNHGNIQGADGMIWQQKWQQSYVRKRSPPELKGRLKRTLSATQRRSKPIQAENDFGQQDREARQQFFAEDQRYFQVNGGQERTQREEGSVNSPGRDKFNHHRRQQQGKDHLNQRVHFREQQHLQDNQTGRNRLIRRHGSAGTQTQLRSSSPQTYQEAPRIILKRQDELIEGQKAFKSDFKRYVEEQKQVYERFKIGNDPRLYSYPESLQLQGFNNFTGGQKVQNSIEQNSTNLNNDVIQTQSNQVAIYEEPQKYANLELSHQNSDDQNQIFQARAFNQRSDLMKGADKHLRSSADLPQLMSSRSHREQNFGFNQRSANDTPGTQKLNTGENQNNLLEEFKQYQLAKHTLSKKDIRVVKTKSEHYAQNFRQPGLRKSADQKPDGQKSLLNVTDQIYRPLFVQSYNLDEGEDKNDVEKKALPKQFIGSTTEAKKQQNFMLKRSLETGNESSVAAKTDRQHSDTFFKMKSQTALRKIDYNKSVKFIQFNSSVQKGQEPQTSNLKLKGKTLHESLLKIQAQITQRDKKSKGFPTLDVKSSTQLAIIEPPEQALAKAELPEPLKIMGDQRSRLKTVVLKQTSQQRKKDWLKLQSFMNNDDELIAPTTALKQINFLKRVRRTNSLHQLHNSDSVNYQGLVASNQNVANSMVKNMSFVRKDKEFSAVVTSQNLNNQHFKYSQLQNQTVSTYKKSESTAVLPYTLASKDHHLPTIKNRDHITIVKKVKKESTRFGDLHMDILDSKVRLPLEL